MHYLSVFAHIHVHVYYDIHVYSFYENIFNISGAAALARQYGEWFTWDGSPRAKIFARNHTQVTNITTMIKLMRYILSTVYMYINLALTLCCHCTIINFTHMHTC